MLTKNAHQTLGNLKEVCASVSYNSHCPSLCCVYHLVSRGAGMTELGGFKQIHTFRERADSGVGVGPGRQEQSQANQDPEGQGQ